MLHHISFPVANLYQSAALYDAALSALGYRRVYSSDDFVGYGIEAGKDKFALSRAAVDVFYTAALAHGATDNGPPGPRPHYGPTYYAAFVIDLDGHRIEAVQNA